MLHIRKMTVLVDDVFSEAGETDGKPQRRAAVMAAVRNPFAGRHEKDLSSLIALGANVGREMVARLIECFGNDPTRIESYGKGALVGTAGEVEHGFSLITRPFAKEVRQAIGNAPGWMASNVKRAALGGKLDVPLAYKVALYVRSHYDTIELSIPDAPLPEEVAVFLVGADRGRLHARIGGLEKDQVTAPDIYCDRE
jgi:hypothetical protein